MSSSSTVSIPLTTHPEMAAIAIATDGIRLPRATSGPVLNLDLMTMAEQLRHEGAWSDGRNTRTLVKHGDFRLVLTVMKTGAHLHKHHARGTVLIQVLSGHIRAHILDEVIEAPAGRAISLDPDLEHEIEALDESALLITIAWPLDFSIVRREAAASPRRRLPSLCSIADHIEAATRPKSVAA